MKRRPWTTLAAGLLAACTGLALQLLLHRINRDIPFPPFSLADAVIRATPGNLATEAIERGGHFARPALAASLAAAIVFACGATATLRRDLPGPAIMLATFAAGSVAPVSPDFADLLLAAAAGGSATALVTGILVRTAPGPPPGSRRTFLLGGLAAGVLLVTGLALATRRTLSSATPPLPATRLDLSPEPGFDEPEGISARITPNAGHYTVDVNLSRPRQDANDWRLDLRGLVASPRRVSYAELATLPVEERAIYLQCISNVANGDLMGNAAWTVATLRDVLDLAGGPLDTATTIVAFAADGYHESYPVESAANLFLALGMGGEAVPNDHGSPARLLFPGHYGMRSLKWLTRIELTREDQPGYWQRRGWDAIAPLRPGARIDTPSGGEQPSGNVVLGGVAWGPEPIIAVECSTDGGATWQPASLEPLVDPVSWTRWRLGLSLPPGEFEIIARAVIASGPQDDVRTPPHPSGANAWHRKTLRIPS